ncbi:MAG: SEC-C metal-binding domain-containing protein [Pseudomonadota bacterium]
MPGDVLFRCLYRRPTSVECASRSSDSSSGGDPCQSAIVSTNRSAFEPTSERRRGYPSETRVKRGQRVVHGDKELVEKLGRNDPCPCGSARRFQTLLYAPETL